MPDGLTSECPISPIGGVASPQVRAIITFRSAM